MCCMVVYTRARFVRLIVQIQKSSVKLLDVYIFSNTVKGVVGALSSFHCVFETVETTSIYGCLHHFLCHLCYCLRSRVSIFFISPMIML